MCTQKYSSTVSTMEAKKMCAQCCNVAQRKYIDFSNERQKVQTAELVCGKSNSPRPWNLFILECVIFRFESPPVPGGFHEISMLRDRKSTLSNVHHCTCSLSVCPQPKVISKTRCGFLIKCPDWLSATQTLRGLTVCITYTQCPHPPCSNGPIWSLPPHSLDRQLGLQSCSHLLTLPRSPLSLSRDCPTPGLF